MTQHRGYFACNTSGISAYWDISKDTTTKGLELVRYLDSEILPTEIPNHFPIIQMSIVDQNITDDAT